MIDLLKTLGFASGLRGVHTANCADISRSIEPSSLLSVLIFDMSEFNVSVSSIQLILFN